MFRYRAGRHRRCCTDIDLDIPAGQVIGIVGPSGSGKSTLTKLIQRLYRPERGQILIDGIDIAPGRSRPGCAARSAWCCRRTCCSTAPSTRTSRSPIPACRARTSSRRRGSPAPTSSSRKLPHGYDTHDRGARRQPFRRPAPAHRHRARAGHQAAHPDLRRGDQRARLRERAHHPEQHAPHRARAARSSSSRIGSAACACATASSPSRTAASSRTARIRNCSRGRTASTASFGGCRPSSSVGMKRALQAWPLRARYRGWRSRRLDAVGSGSKPLRMASSTPVAATPPRRRLSAQLNRALLGLAPLGRTDNPPRKPGDRPLRAEPSGAAAGRHPLPAGAPSPIPAGPARGNAARMRSTTASFCRPHSRCWRRRRRRSRCGLSG